MGARCQRRDYRFVNNMNDFFAALIFLTRLPTPHVELSTESMARAMRFFPLVGILIGGIIAATDALTKLVFLPAPRAALVLATWVIITGGLHLDGFLDCCDGLFVAKPPETRLSILKDTRVGAYAVIGGAALLITKWSAIFALPRGTRWQILLLAPVLARWAMVYATVVYPYARQQESLGKMFKDYVGRRELIIATLTMLGAVLLIHPLAGLMLTFMMWIYVIIAARWVMTRIPGLTGDVYGALGETGETLILLVSCMVIPAWQNILSA